MEKEYKFPTADDIDKIICDEIRDKTVDPELYEIIGDCMMHGPCGAAIKNCTSYLNYLWIIVQFFYHIFF